MQLQELKKLVEFDAIGTLMSYSHADGLYDLSTMFNYVGTTK